MLRGTNNYSPFSLMSDSTASIWQRLGQGITTTRNVVLNALFVLILIVLASSFFGSCQSPRIDDNIALLLQPNGLLVEHESIGNPLQSWLTGSSQEHQIILGELIKVIETAEVDQRIRAIVLDLENLTGLSSVHADALDIALDHFRKSGKEVITYGSWYSQQNYRLASTADAVYLHPMGEILFEGFAAEGLYFKDLLDKLKVQVHVFRVGEFKSAVEPFTENGMSDSARQANRELVDALWTDYTDVVSTNRQLAAGAFAAYVAEIDQRIEAAGGDSARAALEGALVDELLTEDEFNARMVDKVGADDDGNFKAVNFEDYLLATAEAPADLDDANIALIRMTGTIMEGGGDGALSIDPDVMREQIRAARDDENIHALVVRVDSPGGSAFASEQIRKELELVQLTEKPVVISMGEVAASGGYWISSTADAVFSHPQTITGSIGVFSLMPSVELALESVGVRSDGVGTSPLSGLMNPYGALSEPYARIAQASVNRTYIDFVNLVSRGRDLAPEKVAEIAEGRVWLGSRAKDLGLVDQLGTLDDAIAHAAKLATLEEFEVREFAPPVDARYQIIHQFMASRVVSDLIPTRSDMMLRVQAQMQRWLPLLENRRQIYAVCQVCLDLQ
jgi:protease IV